MNCKHCNQHCIRKGKNGTIQKYRCTSCGKYQQKHYRYTSYSVPDKSIILLTKEGVGIRSSSRILQVSPSTILRRILKIARNLRRPFLPVVRKTYEVDELFTYVRRKDNRICIVYSFEKETRTVVDIVVGRRNKTNLSKVISTLLLSDAAKIITDKLPIYKELIPATKHSTKFRGINCIERMNLNLRTHLKRLNRKTICYSKSMAVLLAVVKIYFWG